MKSGYTVLPSLLFYAQDRLGLSPTELNVLLQILVHWWAPEDLPYPSKETIARRIRRDARQVQRVLTALEKRGYIARVHRNRRGGGQASNRYNFDGLVKALQPIAKEFQQVAEETKAKRAQVERRGGLHAKQGRSSPA